jgi:hypothetical protein
LIGTMAGMEATLELVLIVLLGATLFQAVRLERALGVLKRDRASLESLVVGFNASTHQAESGIQRLRSAVDGAGRQIDAQLSKSVALKDDLVFLTERGDRLADRLETLVRVARPLAQDGQARDGQVRDGQVRDGQARDGQARDRPGDKPAPPPSKGVSQVERDLLQALRLAR